MSVVTKIPRGLISDLLDVYDVETLIVQDFFKEASRPSPELNYLYRELLKIMDSLIARADTYPRSNDVANAESFYIPFDDLYSAGKEFKTQGRVLNDKSVMGDVVMEMHATRRRIKDILHSRTVTEDTVKDRGVQKMIADAKRLLGVRQSVPLLEVHVDRKRGIHCYREGNDIYYPKVRPTSQIFKTLLYLVEQREPVGIATLASNTGQVTKSVKRSIEDFNENSRIIFDVKADLIATTGTGLYYANLEKFNFL